MKQIYTVHVNGVAVYHGINAADALESVIAACENGGKLQVQRNAWPIRECCDGVEFHASNCEVVR